MDVRSTAKYLPISPQKLRLVCDKVRGLPPAQAESVLMYMPQKGARYVLKALKSAVANAENNFEMDPAELTIAAIYANEGPRRPWRRFGARGRFKPIIRRTSHLTIVLSQAADDQAGKEES
ncbi:MAG: 50S ribosomal protein L22 [Anaerolineae bacterium]